MNATCLNVFFCRQLECFYVVVPYFEINLTENRYNANFYLLWRSGIIKLLLCSFFSAIFGRSYDYALNLNKFHLALFIKILTAKPGP